MRGSESAVRWLPGRAEEPISRRAEQSGPTQPEHIAPLPAADRDDLTGSRERAEARESRYGLGDEECRGQQQQNESECRTAHPSPFLVRCANALTKSASMDSSRCPRGDAPGIDAG